MCMCDDKKWSSRGCSCWNFLANVEFFGVSALDLHRILLINVEIFVHGFALFLSFSVLFRFICLPYRMLLSVRLSWWVMWYWWPLDRHDLHRHCHWFRSTNCMWILFQAMWMAHGTFPRHDSIYCLNYARCYHFDLSVLKLPMYYYCSVSIVANLSFQFAHIQIIDWKKRKRRRRRGGRRKA